MNAGFEKALHPWIAEGQDRVRFGVEPLGRFSDWKTLLALATRVEELGFDSFWWPDHPTIFLDCWSVLTVLSQHTSTIRLGTAVSCVYYRPPGVTARLASDVDRLSNGRLVLGLGIGDLQSEFARLGLRFPGVRERQQALEDTLHIIRGAWANNPLTFKGATFHVEELQVPPPVQQPHVPLLIGGGGERTLRQVAQYADMTNFGPLGLIGGVVSLDDVRAKLTVLRHHCETVSRTYESILRSHYALPLVVRRTDEDAQAEVNSASSAAVVGSVSKIIEYYESLVEAGMQYFIACPRPDDMETLELLSQEVMPSVQDRTRRA